MSLLYAGLALGGGSIGYCGRSLDMRGMGMLKRDRVARRVLGCAVVETLEERRLMAVCGQEFALGHGQGEFPAVAATPDGGFVTAWVNRQAYVQRFDADGTPRGPKLAVSEDPGIRVGVAVAADGQFTVIWLSEIKQGGVSTGTYGVFGKRFSAAGVAEGDSFHVESADNTWEPSIAMASDGEFAIAYTRQISSYSAGIFVRRFDANGTLLDNGEITVAATSSLYNSPAIAMGADGQVVVAWQDDAYGSDILARRIDAAGQPIGEPFQLNTYTSARQGAPAVAMAASGAWTAVWQGFEGNGIAVRRYSADGQPLDAAEARVDGKESYLMQLPSIAMAPDGQFSVGWMSGDRDATYARRYNSEGQAIGGDVRVSSQNTSDNDHPRVAVGQHGELVTVWQIDSSLSLHAVRYGGALNAICGGPYNVGEGGGQVALAGSSQWTPEHPVTRYEWDYNYDGTTFDVDATAQSPVYVAPYVGADETRTIGLRVVADDGSVSNVATTQLTIKNWLPSVTVSGPTQVTEGGNAAFVGSLSNALDGQSVTYQWDWDYDGKTFDVNATGQTPQFVASSLAAETVRTIGLRAVASDGSVSKVVTTTVTVVNAAPTATISSVEQVTLGAAGWVTLSDLKDSPADLAAGLRYSFDLNGDGVNEVKNSTSPTCTVPPEYLATPGFHRIRARVKDRWNAVREYSTQILVNMPQDWFPMVAGLTYRFSGTDDGVSQPASFNTGFQQWNGKDAYIVHESDEGAHWGTSDYFYVKNGSAVLRIGEHDNDADGTMDFDFGNGLLWWDFGQSQAASGVPFTLSMTAAGGVSAAGGGKVNMQVTVVGVQPLTLATGLSFPEALLVREHVVTTVNLKSNTGASENDVATGDDSAYFVRGLGQVYEWYTMRHSDGETSTTEQKLDAIPSWATFTSVNDGVLRVCGTDSDDHISFQVSGANLVVYRNGVSNSVPMAGLKGVLVGGYMGNDVIDASALSIPVTINGGKGADTITGGSASDSLSGGTGPDVIQGGLGFDTIHGGAGNDLLRGGNNADSIYGDGGDDTVYGGKGLDYIDVHDGAGGDWVDAMDGTDTVVADEADPVYNAEQRYVAGASAASGVRAVRGHGVTVTWTAGTQVQTYTVQRSTDGVSYSTLGSVAGSVLSYGDASAGASGTYWYRVVASNPLGGATSGVAKAA